MGVTARVPDERPGRLNLVGLSDAAVLEKLGEPAFRRMRGRLYGEGGRMMGEKRMIRESRMIRENRMIRERGMIRERRMIRENRMI